MAEKKQNTIIHLSITGMMCSGCVNAVKTALESVSGVESVNIKLEKKEAVVTYDPTMSTEDEMKNAVEKAGYHIGI